MPDASWAGPGVTNAHGRTHLFIHSLIHPFILVQVWRLQQENAYLRQQLGSAAEGACTPVPPSGPDQAQQAGEDWAGTACTGAVLPAGDSIALADKSGQSLQLGGVSLCPSHHEQEVEAMSVAPESQPSSASLKA